MRGQISQELLLVIVAALIIFSMFMSVYLSQLNYIQNTKDRLQGEQTAYKIAQAINYVYLAGDGTDYNLSVVASRTTITVSGRFITAENNEGSAFFQAYILTNMSTATINNSGVITIRNRGGTIAIQ